MNEKFQPFEAHIPFLMHFLVDNCLYGMNFVDVSTLQFRQPLPKRLVELLLLSCFCSQIPYSNAYFTCCPLCIRNILSFVVVCLERVVVNYSVGWVWQNCHVGPRIWNNSIDIHRVFPSIFIRASPPSSYVAGEFWLLFGALLTSGCEQLLISTKH